MLGDLKHSERRGDFGHYRCIHVEELKGAIRRIRKGRATRSYEILVEFQRSVERVGME